MSVPVLVLLVAPFVVIVVMFTAVVIVALFRARAEDVPAVLAECVTIFRGLAGRVLGAEPDTETSDVRRKESA
jgi:hypothetical protein